ncbi:Cu(I)-responsive transcriptional regulator [Sphingomonas koreensis]|jgi:hypothetical protein|uniref:Cu(I)-responsive transcriptional regulator n=1 Tax=Sphingomonas koreensis TaxID=93064 RepID=A0AAJ4VBK7_9SPHN|nr:hypothetical protein [Sphingomonas koreensis]RSU26997.1 Cu(I)-responsive transcriptional regulator [Sphingomonas koreensis]RSU31501.1 Cu(I)-responsive transcriptional regulator [Sphingomonas koreensis]RSU42075.1 Cu(I)-responsive transcriptional regulator [Sphingomonas koreensis]RSU83874.1 Cu(I)-responsive transcriptional regulator [Sphingomonas koreensis]RSU85976.1 Cu(I)-responsive transcriptional regulator [Sphingomonas koreensis]
MRIGKAVRAGAMAAWAIGYCSRLGLAASAARTGPARRVRSHELCAIRCGGDLALLVERIVILRRLWRSHSGTDAGTIALGHARELRRRIAELEAMACALEHVAARSGGVERPR